MMRTTKSSWPLLVSIAAVACGGVSENSGAGTDPGLEASEPEQIGEVSQAATLCTGSAVIQRNWQPSDGTRFLAPASTHVCALHKIQGSFRGWGESVWVAQDGNNWFIGGISSQPGVSSSAVCVERSCFERPAGDGFSQEFATTTVGTVISGEDLCSFDTYARMWAGDSANMITAVTGRLEGDGERAHIEDNGPSSNSFLSVGACGRNHMRAGAHSYFAGRPLQQPRFYETSPGAGSEFFADAGAFSTGVDVKTLAPVTKAFCYLTYVSGRFAGATDRIQLLPEAVAGVMRWQLTVQGQAGSGAQRPRAGVRCMLYAQ